MSGWRRGRGIDQTWWSSWCNVGACCWHLGGRRRKSVEATEVVVRWWIANEDGRCRRRSRPLAVGWRTSTFCRKSDCAGCCKSRWICGTATCCRTEEFLRCCGRRSARPLVGRNESRRRCSVLATEDGSDGRTSCPASRSVASWRDQISAFKKNRNFQILIKWNNKWDHWRMSTVPGGWWTLRKRIPAIEMCWTWKWQLHWVGWKRKLCPAVI